MLQIPLCVSWGPSSALCHVHRASFFQMAPEAVHRRFRNPSPNDPHRSPRCHNARASENLPELWPEMTKASRFPVSHIPPLSSTIGLEHLARVKCHVIWSWVVSLQPPLSPNTHSHSHTHSQTCTHIHPLTQSYTHTLTHAFMSVHTQAHTHMLSFFPSTSHSVSN